MTCRRDKSWWWRRRRFACVCRLLRFTCLGFAVHLALGLPVSHVHICTEQIYGLHGCQLSSTYSRYLLHRTLKRKRCKWQSPMQSILLCVRIKTYFFSSIELNRSVGIYGSAISAFDTIDIVLPRLICQNAKYKALQLHAIMLFAI